MSKKIIRYDRGFTAKTDNQKEFVRSVAENHVTICHGLAGTGKTYCSLALACEYLTNKKVNNILIAKTITTCGKSIGALPGFVNDKILTYYVYIIDYLNRFLGETTARNMIADKVIQLTPIEVLRGYSLDNTFIILDEAQNCDPKQMKMFMSRIGKGSKMVISGDSKQSDILSNGLQFCVDKLSGISGLGIIKFGVEDIQRHPIIGDVMKVFDNFGY